MYAEVTWVLVSSGTQVQSQIILDPDYLPDYLSVSYDYDIIEYKHTLYRWEDCVKKFYTSLRKHATNVINFEKKKLLPLTKEALK